MVRIILSRIAKHKNYVTCCLCVEIIRKITLLFLTKRQMLKQILTEDLEMTFKNLKQLHYKKIFLASTHIANSRAAKLNFSKK